MMTKGTKRDLSLESAIETNNINDTIEVGAHVETFLTRQNNSRIQKADDLARVIADR